VGNEHTDAPRPWLAALNALVRAAIVIGQSRPGADVASIELDLDPMIEAVVVLREGGTCQS
jgi:hypothetical protein